MVPLKVVSPPLAMSQEETPKGEWEERGLLHNYCPHQGHILNIQKQRSRNKCQYSQTLKLSMQDSVF